MIALTFRLLQGSHDVTGLLARDPFPDKPPRYVRAMGYLHEQVSIKARHDRCRRAWEPHLERTKDVLRAAVRKCRTRRKFAFWN